MRAGDGGVAGGGRRDLDEPGGLLERAEELLQIARLTGKRCDQLLVELAKSDFQAAETTAMVLLTRFHKRIIGHSFNILSSVVMPLHKVDFYDEQFLESTTPSDV